MRTPSRKMPSASAFERTAAQRLLGHFAGACLIGLVGWALWLYPIPALAVIAVIVLGTVYERRRLRKLAADRSEESICEFARSFDRRRADTKLIRAVYEEVGALVGLPGRTFPLRASDELFPHHALNIDPEDVEEIVATVAARAGRSLIGLKLNPMYGSVTTVADIVTLLQHQPESSGA